MCVLNTTATVLCTLSHKRATRRIERIVCECPRIGTLSNEHMCECAMLFALLVQAMHDRVACNNIWNAEIRTPHIGVRCALPSKQHVRNA